MDETMTSGDWVLVIIMIAIILAIKGYSKKLQKAKEAEEATRKARVNSRLREYYETALNGSIITGKYTTGHPKLNNPIDHLNMKIEDNKLRFFSVDMHKLYEVLNSDAPLDTVAPVLEMEIPIDAIKNVNTDEGKKTSRLFISWKYNKFSYKTTFEFEGEDGAQTAHAVRNKIVDVLTSIEENEQEED
jgi:hypothetical protein